MLTTRFDFQTDDGWTGYYVCDRRNTDQSGEYVRATVAERLLVACKRSMYSFTEEHEDEWRQSQSHPEAPYHFLWLAITAAEAPYPPDLGDDS
jgi:hypothetical protein